MTDNLELLVLGSGGPFANPTRASSGFLILRDDAPVALVDAGGGVFERLGQAGISTAAIGLVLLTHFHIDHSGGLPPIVFSAFIGGRTKPVALVGPAPLGNQPGASRFAEALFGEDGAWSYLHSFEGFGIDAIEMASDSEDSEIEAVPIGYPQVRSVAVPHGMMPTIAYRVELPDSTSIAFTGDVQEGHEPLVELASGCDLLICDFALPERETEHSHLHAKPSEVGELAKRCGCSRLLLTHVMPELENEIAPALDLVRERFGGEVIVAEDLMRVPIAAAEDPATAADA